MARRSVKAQLIDELELRAANSGPGQIATYLTTRALELRRRGSGALPAWAKDLARQWGIT